MIPPAHFLVQTARGHHARALSRLGRHAEAIAELAEVVETLGKGRSAKSETSQLALSLLGDELSALGRVGEATERHRAALAVATERLGAGHPTVARYTCDLADDLVHPQAPGEPATRRAEAKALLAAARRELAAKSPGSGGLAELVELDRRLAPLAD